ncbi:MAG: hypothetical protein WD708_12145 [Kiritimatiellia bacterium]
MSLFPVDVLMHVYMFCDALGHPAFAEQERLAPDDILAEALLQIKELGRLCPPESFERNPIRTAEHMTQTDAAAYCPFAYGYSNYSRPGYAPGLLKAGELVQFQGQPLRSTLGGAGLAVSAKSAHRDIAADYARFTAAPETQKGIYFEAGGQPGHRAVWTDARVNAASSNFFQDTLPTLDAARLRPQYRGYMDFQDHASPVAHAAVAGRMTVSDSVRELNRIFEKSLR